MKNANLITLSFLLRKLHGLSAVSSSASSISQILTSLQLVHMISWFDYGTCGVLQTKQTQQLHLMRVNFLRSSRWLTIVLKDNLPLRLKKKLLRIGLLWIHQLVVDINSLTQRRVKTSYHLKEKRESVNVKSQSANARERPQKELTAKMTPGKGHL